MSGMRVAFSRFSFSFVVPGADDVFVRLLSDAIQEVSSGDDRFSVSRDGSTIVVSVAPRFSDTVTLDNLDVMVGGYAQNVRGLIQQAYSVAESRYQLYRDLQRIEDVVSAPDDPVSGLVPSLW